MLLQVRWVSVGLVILVLAGLALERDERLAACREELRAERATVAARDSDVARLRRRIAELGAELEPARAVPERLRERDQVKVRRWLERVAIPRDAALRAARADAARLGTRILTEYHEEATLEYDGWHVRYSVGGAAVAGGVVDYLIDPLDASITSRIIQQ